MQLKGFIKINANSISLILIFILGVLFLNKLFTIREGNKPKEEDPPPPEMSAGDAQDLGDDIQSTVKQKLAAKKVPFKAPDTTDLFKQLTDIMKQEINYSQQRTGINAAEFAKANNISPSGNTVTPKLINNSFFLGNKFSAAFCDKYIGTSELGDKCATLTADNCNLTDCCVYVNGTKCMAGGANGPTNITGVTTDTDYYLYKYQCHGNCLSESKCSKYTDGDKNVSDDCLKEMWANAGCTTSILNTNWWKKQTKKGVYNDMSFWASMPDAGHRKACYGEFKSQWPELNSNYKRVFGNNGTVSCSRYCKGTQGKSWNNELPSKWRGAECAAAGFDDAADCNSVAGYSASGTQCVCERKDDTPWAQ